MKHSKASTIIFVIFVGIITIFTSVYIALLSDSKIQVKVDVPEQQVSWQIYKIEPNNSVYNLSVKSNLGQIRTYTDIDSYGLSFAGKYLAIYKGGTFQIIDLNTDTVSKIEMDLQNLIINKGESLSWNNQDTFFTTSGLDTKTQSAYVIIFNTNQLNFKLIAADIPHSNGNLEPTIFSHSGSNLIVRTYKSEDLQYPNSDGSLPTFYEVPSYLSIFNPSGELVIELLVSDLYKVQYIQYGFDVKGRVKYYISNNPISDVIPDNNFIKVQI